MLSMKRGLIYFLSFVALMIPVLVLAQQIPNNVLFGDTGGLVPCSGTDCGTCQLIVLGNRVMRFIIMIMIAGVVLLAAWGGFNLLISGGNPSEYTRAKSMLKNVLVGLILMLVAWLIIDTGMKALLKNSGQVQMSAGQWLPWNQVSCSNHVPLSDGLAILPGSSGWEIVQSFIQNASNTTAVAAGIGVCSPSFLNQYFPGQTGTAACVLQGESVCGSTHNSTVDVTQNGVPYSVGMWQWNLTVNDIQGCSNTPDLNCPAAFTGTNNNAVLVDPTLYQKCSTALKDVNCATINALRLVNTTPKSWDNWSYYKNCN